jgi:metal-responsive CopG/Arc/MetJ family transcriptional regulator
MELARMEVSLPKEKLDKFKVIAKSRKVTVSKLIREYMNRVIAQNANKD